MKPMTLPGFTASRSLYRVTGRYQVLAGRPPGSAGLPIVRPQLKRQLDLLLCLQGCALAGSDPGCTDTCYRLEHIGASDDFGNPDSGGGGGDDGCRPGCGPCLRAPGSRRRTRTCVTADCETVTRRC